MHQKRISVLCLRYPPPEKINQISIFYAPDKGGICFGYIEPIVVYKQLHEMTVTIYEGHTTASVQYMRFLRYICTPDIKP
ncbi:MAG TPA: hypothetical protein VGZ90_02410 [Puia sp.]|nr:hypothetical protein [Puia sp.]